MSNRMIKDSMLASDKIASLSDFEFRLWIGLILIVDDMGRGDARPAIIKGRVFPLRERVSMRDVEDALHGLAAKGCISLYEVDGKSYFWFPTWGKHQRIRDVRPKYPGPDDESAARPPSPHSAADCRNARPEDEDESKTNTNPNPKTKTNSVRTQGIVGVVVEAVGELGKSGINELAGFSRDMGEECVLKALDAARDAGKPTWAYVRGVLRHKLEQGVRSAEDWDKAEASFQAAKGGGAASGAMKGAIAGTPRDVQPSPERAKRSADWLEGFLAEQEGKV